MDGGVGKEKKKEASLTELCKDDKSMECEEQGPSVQSVQSVTEPVPVWPY